jgi:hypothetical protein
VAPAPSAGALAALSGWPDKPTILR